VIFCMVNAEFGINSSQKLRDILESSMCCHSIGQD
jgi:hypothetical protein